MELKQLCTDRGFEAAFWEEYRLQERLGYRPTREDVFEIVNHYYEEEVGQPRYPSYDAFRMRIRRLNIKKK